jgi:hypothetical protein
VLLGMPGHPTDDGRQTTHREYAVGTTAMPSIGSGPESKIQPVPMTATPLTMTAA